MWRADAVRINIVSNMKFYFKSDDNRSECVRFVADRVAHKRVLPFKQSHRFIPSIVRFYACHFGRVNRDNRI